jgi:hypothetical protein
VRAASAWKSRLSALPSWSWSLIYYTALFFLYRFLIYGFVSDRLDRQLLGLSDTLALTAVFFGYLILCAIPPFVWSRRGFYHPIWRGVESFACYLLVSLVLGAIFAASDDGSWSALSGISASGAAWARIGSVVAIFMVFIAASWWGGRSATGRKRRMSSRRRRNNGAVAS